MPRPLPLRYGAGRIELGKGRERKAFHKGGERAAHTEGQLHLEGPVTILSP